MKTVVRFLCILTVARLCAANLFDDLYHGIEIPENCTLSSEDSSEDTDKYWLTCPELLMAMEATIYNDNHVQNFTQYESKIKCSPELSPNFLPYKYLPNMKSERNSLWLEDCQLPEHGSFGDGWPRLNFFFFFNSNSIGRLKREHFSGLQNVWNLILLFRSSSHPMPDDLFTDLTKLRQLLLKGEVNKNVLTNLTKLEKLRISIPTRESVDRFDTIDMKNLTAFTYLQIFDTHFTRLTKRFFEGCQYVEDLKITSCNIEAIDADAFEPLTNLKNITFSFTDLSSIPQGLFSKNLKLEKVTMIYKNRRTSLPAGFLSNLPNLREIKIENCNLYSIPNDLIRGSFNLEILHLQFNDLSLLPRDLLQNHTKLKKINLFGNLLNETSYDLFDDMSPATKVSYTYEKFKNK